MSIWSHTMFRVYWSFALSEVTYTHTHHTIDRKKISKQTHQLNNIQKNRVEVNSEAKIQPQQTNQPTKSHPCTTAHTHTARVDRFDQASSSLHAVWCQITFRTLSNKRVCKNEWNFDRYSRLPKNVFPIDFEWDFETKIHHFHMGLHEKIKNESKFNQKLSSKTEKQMQYLFGAQIWDVIWYHKWGVQTILS